MIGFRFSVKIIYFELHKPKVEDRKFILIYGSGVSGLITKRTIEKDPAISSKVVGFLDDNQKLEGNRLEGVPIYHSAQLVELIKKHSITELIVAIQKPDKKNITNVVEIGRASCRERV